MRTSVSCCAALAATLLATSSGLACDPGFSACRPAVVVFPVVTPEGIPIGSIEARVRPSLPLERSRFTGQPLTVVDNNPGRLAGAVDPTVELVPLPRAKPSRTRAVYPKGY